jgi:N-methylhydantoinase A/oxoprolinase/acetone carboxylase beta subunit
LLLGIDVGGTFTDAVIIENERVLYSAKRHTTHGNVAEGLLAALDGVLEGSGAAGKLKRAAISTTLVTNAIATGQLPKVNIFAVPGPGFDCRKAFPAPPVVIDGYTDHRGHNVHYAKLPATAGGFLAGAPAVVSAKFSVRNPESELALERELKARGVKDVVTGHSMSGLLGFIRRTNSAYYTAATLDLCAGFFAAVREGLKKRAIHAPLYVLKADGGTMPENLAGRYTAETYFTGPAASAVGIKALVNPARRAVSLDIGGTTTDIAFWEGNRPLFGKRGAKINGYPTAVRALHLSSVPVGGDSCLKRTESGIAIGPGRVGPAMALGGSVPTLTDAFLLLRFDDFGDVEKARSAMRSLARPGEAPEAVAGEAVRAAAGKIVAVIREMIEEYALEPVYRVEDVIKAHKFAPELVIGIGGAAKGLVPEIAGQLGLPFDIPAAALVANAVGAAVARPTILGVLRADTALGRCILPQAAQGMDIDRKFSVRDGEILLTEWLRREAQNGGVEFHGAETLWQEQFPVIRDGWQSGNIINIAMQLTPGVFFTVKGAGGQ